MKKIISAVVTIMGMLVVLGISAPAATAGSNNGTNNWYQTFGPRWVSGGNLAGSNYDIRGSDGTVWQEYHIDADRSGGTGTAPRLYFRKTGVSTWTPLNCWNDCYFRMANQWTYYDWMVIFADGSRTAYGAF